jgi:hypothetical protein
MKTTIFAILISVVLTGCQFSKSVKKDFISGLTTTGNNLSCDDVFLSVNNEKTDRNIFIYGETFFINYNDIKGFTREKENVFPGMELVIRNQAGDTVMQTNDLYSEYPSGINYSPLKLTADLTVASPIKSKGEYTLNVKIWDKKGPGIFTTKFNFKVKENEQITIDPSNVSYDEIYLFSQGSDKVITDNKIKFDDNIYLIFEGIKGFKAENGMVFPGLSLKATDSKNNMIIDYDDLFLDYSETGLAATDFISRVSAHFKITRAEFKNPLHCVLVIWDKKSDARVKVTANLILE